MGKREIVRSWKDPTYRDGLSAEAQSELPPNPAGTVELTDDQLRQASGLGGSIVTTFRTCTEFTYRRYQCCQ
jgi:mersacidin/lichenicidin family type 2 lantibiotic